MILVDRWLNQGGSFEQRLEGYDDSIATEALESIRILLETNYLIFSTDPHAFSQILRAPYNPVFYSPKHNVIAKNIMSKLLQIKWDNPEQYIYRPVLIFFQALGTVPGTKGRLECFQKVMNYLQPALKIAA